MWLSCVAIGIHNAAGSASGRVGLWHSGRGSYGGFYDLTPVVLEVPYDDHWWLVVDSNPDRIRVTVNQVFD